MNSIMLQVIRNPKQCQIVAKWTGIYRTTSQIVNFGGSHPSGLLPFDDHAAIWQAIWCAIPYKISFNQCIILPTRR